MKVIIHKDSKKLGIEAGIRAAFLIRKVIKAKGSATIILATGSSQFETLNHLVNKEKVEWNKVVMFHLDEYIGLPISHPAGFRKYLKDRFLDKVGRLKGFHLINGETDPEKECRRLDRLITNNPVDVALLGIGENGHLAFNDPPADFETRKPFIIANLDERCRQQQVNENWFRFIHDVPKQAITMSVGQIMLSKHIVCAVPDGRKAKAVKDCLKRKVSNLFPASILQIHPDCHIFLENASACLLKAGQLSSEK